MNKEELKNALQKDIDRYFSWIRDYRNAVLAVPDDLDEYLPDTSWLDENSNVYWNTSCHTSELVIIIPWNPDIFDTLALEIERLGWEIKSEDKSIWQDKPEYYIYYIHPELERIKIKLNMESSRDGTTCKLVQTGTEIVEKPIWEVRCAESEEL